MEVIPMINRPELKKQAKESLKGKWGIAIGLMLLHGVIASALSYTAIGGLLVGVFSIGYLFAGMRIIRGEKPEVKDLFAGFSGNFLNNLAASVLVPLFTFLWTLLFIIPGIVKSYSYAMTYYILNDNPEMGAIEAITASRKMMNGHKMELFLLHLSFIGWILLSLLTFGILLFYVNPYMQEAQAAFYEKIKAQPAENAEPAVAAAE
jgi:uncharacterized membrane protein